MDHDWGTPTPSGSPADASRKKYMSEPSTRTGSSQAYSTHCVPFRGHVPQRGESAEDSGSCPSLTASTDSQDDV